MEVWAWLRMLLDRRTWATARVSRRIRPFYRTVYAAGLVRGGMLDVLAPGRVPFDTLAARYCPTGSAAERDALDAWLRLGVCLGELGRRGDGYSLRGRLSRDLVAPENDAARALLLSVTGVHHQFLAHGLERLAGGRWLTLTEHDGGVVARSSRTVEPLVCAVLDRVVPRTGPFSVLEVACGSGVYMGHAARRNPELTAVGVELDPGVAEAARTNLAAWGLASQVRVMTGDVRDWPAGPAHDVVTLFNCLYYFPVGERTGLLRHLRGCLRPGGRLALTTWARGGGVGGEGINLWFALTEGCGRLPDREEVMTHLKEAGFAGVRTWHLIPGERYDAYLASA